MVIFYGIILFVLTVTCFYFITLLIKKIFVALSKKRRIRYDNYDDNSDTSVDNFNKSNFSNTSKAILGARKIMRGKKNGR